MRSPDHAAPLDAAWPDRGGVYVLVTAALSSRPVPETIEACARGGASAIQLREKGLPRDDWLARAREACAVAREHGLAFVVNDSAEIAAACGADGVHLGTGDAAIADVRHSYGADLRIGASCHSMVDVMRAIEAGADSLGLGPVFGTTTKAIEHTVGVAFVREAIEFADRPCFPIGGIDETNIDAVVDAGATGVAVCRAVIASPDIEGAVAALVTRLDTGRLDAGRKSS